MDAIAALRDGPIFRDDDTYIVTKFGERKTEARC